MDNNISGVNFRANLVTKMKGRHDLLTKVGEEFSRQTRHLPGEMRLERADFIVGNKKVLDFNVGGLSLLVTQSKNKPLLGNNLENKEDITPELVKDVTKVFVNIFKALSSEVKFTEGTDSLVKNIRSTKKALKNNQILADYTARKGNKEASAMYTKLAEHNSKRLAQLNAQYSKEKAIFLEKANEIGKDEPYLDTWHQMMNEDYSN